MILSIKKGTSGIDVFYTNKDFSHNLYCSDFKFDNGQLKTIEFSFEEIIKSRTGSNSKDDLKDFIEYVDKIETIRFSDNTIKKSLLRKLANNEKVQLKVIAGKTLELEMFITYGKYDEFELKKTSR